MLILAPFIHDVARRSEYTVRSKYRSSNVGLSVSALTATVKRTTHQVFRRVGKQAIRNYRLRCVCPHVRLSAGISEAPT